jgi:hypothetical protein
MEGLISLGIYDHTGKLVRILHKAATGDEFVAALDGYITHWDGLDDAGNPLPPGHYSARGYMVGAVTVRATGSNTIPTPSPAPAASPQSQTDLIESGFSFKFPDGKPFFPQPKIHVNLVPNPLDRDRAGSADLTVAFDATGSWLQLSDGLPLKQISATPNLKWIVMGRSAPGEPLIIFQSDTVPLVQTSGTSASTQPVFSFQSPNYTVETYTITKTSDMMSFDAGPFDLPTPASPTPTP